MEAINDIVSLLRYSKVLKLNNQEAHHKKYFPTSHQDAAVFDARQALNLVFVIFGEYQCDPQDLLKKADIRSIAAASIAFIVIVPEAQ
jgi:hypothetical protein